MTERLISEREEKILGPKCAEYVNLYTMVHYMETGLLLATHVTLQVWMRYLPGKIRRGIK